MYRHEAGPKDKNAQERIKHESPVLWMKAVFACVSPQLELITLSVDLKGPQLLNHCVSESW